MTAENAYNIRSYRKKKYKWGHVKFLMRLGLDIAIQNKVDASHQQRSRAYIIKQILISIRPYTYCGPRWRSRYSDSWRAGWFKDRILVEARFSASVQTGPGAHAAYYRVSVLEVKRPRRGVNHPLSSSAEVKHRVRLYLYSPLGLHGLL
jgi:hypothetical protein